jgi:hypothetical protein
MRRRDLTPDERFERSARFWARAYPRRWREVHGDELLAVQQDVARAAAGAAGAPVPDRLSTDEVRSLLRAGWGLRRRERPPLWRWVLYRCFDVRLPARYWWWVADDIHGALYTWRTAYASPVLLALIWSAPSVLARLGLWGGAYAGLLVEDRWMFLALFTVGLLAGFTFRKTRIRNGWRRHVMEGNMPSPPWVPTPLPPADARD